MTTTAAGPASRGVLGPTQDHAAAGLVITGEAVALELRPAGVAHRLLSGLIDLGIYAAASIALLLGLSRLVQNSAHLGILIVVVSVTMMVALPTTVESLTRGLSAGKLAAGLRVVRDDGGPIRFRHALVRAMLGVVEIWLTFGGLAVITSIINKRDKRLGDLLAGTYAIRVRGTEEALAPLLMPPDLATWAELADIRRLPDELALYARLHLSRTSAMSPAFREPRARALAASLEPYVSPPPPWGTNPERFLAAVLVARRDREYRAAVAQEERATERANRTRRLPYGIPDVS
ncbi:RDD family protein [Pseudactinotalea sp.]|uniref:RDD family protein n=1 Tax=Pseudactinotalea sp. TaxID=1926260 RepID=UPI003B3AA56B